MEINNLTEQRARLAHEQADAQEIKNAVLRSELLVADEVEREWADIIRKLRAGIMSITGRIRQRIDLSPADAALIDREIRDALTVLSGDGDYPPSGADGPSTTAETETIHVH